MDGSDRALSAEPVDAHAIGLDGMDLQLTFLHDVEDSEIQRSALTAFRSSRLSSARSASPRKRPLIWVSMSSPQHDSGSVLQRCAMFSRPKLPEAFSTR